MKDGEGWVWGNKDGNNLTHVSNSGLTGRIQHFLKTLLRVQAKCPH